MKTVKHHLCSECEKDLTMAKLVHKKVPNSEEGTTCDFCHRRRYCAEYVIQYGRKNNV